MLRQQQKLILEFSSLAFIRAIFSKHLLDAQLFWGKCLRKTFTFTFWHQPHQLFNWTKLNFRTDAWQLTVPVRSTDWKPWCMLQTASRIKISSLNLKKPQTLNY